MDELEENVMAVVASYFSVLSEPMRLKIARVICEQEKSVSQIVQETGATQSNVSRHLQLMHRHGIVSKRRQGNLVYYRVSDPAMMDICRTVCMQILNRIDEREPLRKGLLRLVPASQRKVG
ncbi:MAG TPA: metalloregulator ArsR/SmtB family transcription factor [Burkholderiales bacterium]